MPQDMDIALLRSFAAVAESGRMTQAAKSLHLTQSAVSQRIKRLEDQLGLALFERRADAAHLTRDGERFLGRARRLIVFHDEMLREMRGGDFAGEVRFGVPHDVVGTIMPAILGKFHKLHPNVLVTLVSETTAVLCKLLNERAIEFSLTTERERAAASVFERVHLLLDDVRAATRRADEEVRVLESGRVDPPVAVERTEALGLADDSLPERLVGREDVMRSSLCLELQEARSSARKGLRARSSPSVVGGPWPG